MSSLTINLDSLSSLSSDEDEIQPEIQKDPNQEFLILILGGDVDDVRRFYLYNREYISDETINRGFSLGATAYYFNKPNANLDFVKFFFNETGIRLLNKRIIENVFERTNNQDVKNYIKEYIKRRREILMLGNYLNI